MVQMLILGLLVRAVGSAMPCSDSVQQGRSLIGRHCVLPFAGRPSDATHTMVDSHAYLIISPNCRPSWSSGTSGELPAAQAPGLPQVRDVVFDVSVQPALL